MEPIRILQVVTIMNRGGLETMIMNYYRKIDREKIQFDFMVHRMEPGDYDDEIESMGGKIYRMPNIRPGNYRKYFKQLDKFFENHKEYKVVHSHINENSGFVLRAAKEHGIECRIAHSHTANLKLDYKYPFRMYGRYYLNKNVNQYFACSKEAGRWLFKNPKKDIIILKNVIDVDLFKRDDKKRTELRKALKLENKFVIGHVGRFNASKNHTFLIDIFSEIVKKRKDAYLILVGEGSLMAHIKDKVSKLNIQDNVLFLGLRSDVYNLMQVMDLFLFPSLFEGLPVVLVEAQAAGLKIVTSTGVPTEADLTNSLEFYDLKLSPKEWAEKILSLNIDVNNYSDILKEKGYDSNINVKWLTDFYLKYY